MTLIASAPEFTTSQLDHAQSVLIRLMKEHRFFPYQYDQRNSRSLSQYQIDREQFARVWEFNDMYRDAYRQARTSGEKAILEAGKRLGIKAPTIPPDRVLVQANFFSGGFDVCGVYPLAAFAGYMPASQDALRAELYGAMINGRDLGDIAPNKLSRIETSASARAEQIWQELSGLALAPVSANVEDNRCVVLLQALFSHGSYYRKQDLAQGKLIGMQEHPHALGRLFYMRSMEHRMVDHTRVIFSSDSEDHVVMEHWSDKMPSIYFHAEGAYSSSCMYAVLL